MAKRNGFLYEACQYRHIWKKLILNLQMLSTRLRKLFYVVRSKRFFISLLFYNVLASTDHYPILKNGFRTIVDIGANRGQFALAAKEWSPDAKIIAFEPLPAAIDKFRRIFHDNENVIIHQTAIGSRNGQTTLHVSALDDSSSLLPISLLQETLFPGTEEVGHLKVEIGRLSDYVDSRQITAPALLKIDVQGYELEVLRGCHDRLNCFSHVYAECSFMELYSGQALAGEVIDWLGKQGFKFIGVFNMVSDKFGNSVQADFLFKNANSDPK